jgi:hypothetical protein
MKGANHLAGNAGHGDGLPHSPHQIDVLPVVVLGLIRLPDEFGVGQVEGAQLAEAARGRPGLGRLGIHGRGTLQGGFLGPAVPALADQEAALAVVPSIFDRAVRSTPADGV